MKINSIFLDTIDSTNSYAKREGANFEKGALTVISAKEQTSGRGRFQRKWLSPKEKNLLLTVSLFLPANTKDLIRIGQLLSLSGAFLLQELNFQPKIKWPNDFLINNKKVGGILTEFCQNEMLTQIVLGIGLNVNVDQKWLDTLDQPATSLFIESHKTWNLEEIRARLCEHFLKNLKIFLKQGFDPFHLEFIHFLAYLGQMIECNGEKGIFETISSDGALLLKKEDGSLKKILSGDLS